MISVVALIVKHGTVCHCHSMLLKHLY